VAGGTADLPQVNTLLAAPARRSPTGGWRYCRSSPGKHFVNSTCKEESNWWLEVQQIFPRTGSFKEMKKFNFFSV
jgi:hypothetical protein